MDLEEYIEYQRKRKHTEEQARLKREAATRKKMRNMQATDNSNEDVDANRMMRTRPTEVREVNANKLPKIIKDGFDIKVPEEFIRVNKAQEKQDRRKAKLIYSNNDMDRPMSARSG